MRRRAEPTIRGDFHLELLTGLVLADQLTPNSGAPATSGFHKHLMSTRFVG